MGGKRKSKSKTARSESSENESNDESDEEEELDEEVPDDLKQYITKEAWNSYSPARKDSFKSMFLNPNCFFYRNRPPGEPQKLGPFTPEEKELFLKRIKYFRDELHVYDKLWGLFATPFTGRFGYQCMNFYRHLLDEGELKKAAKNTKVDPEVLKMLNDQAISYIKKCLSDNITIMQPQYRSSKQVSKSESSTSSSSDEFDINSPETLGKSKNISNKITKTQSSAKQSSQMNENDLKSDDLYNSSDSDDYSDYSTFAKSKQSPKKQVRKNPKGKNANNKSYSEDEDRKKSINKITKIQKEITNEDDNNPNEITTNKPTNLKTNSNKKKASQINKKKANNSDYESNNEKSYESTHETNEDNILIEKESNRERSSEEEISLKKSQNAIIVDASTDTIRNKQKKKLIDNSDISSNTSQQKQQKKPNNNQIDDYMSDSDSNDYSYDNRKMTDKRKAKNNSNILDHKKIASKKSLNNRNKQPSTNEISEIDYAPDPITNIPMENPLLDPICGIVMDKATWKDYFDQKFISPYFICVNNMNELLPVTQVVLNEYRNQIVNVYI